MNVLMVIFYNSKLSLCKYIIVLNAVLIVKPAMDNLNTNALHAIRDTFLMITNVFKDVPLTNMKIYLGIVINVLIYVITVMVQEVFNVSIVVMEPTFLMDIAINPVQFIHIITH